MSIKGQKNFNVTIAAEIQESFTKQVDERGYTKYRALEAAIKGFLSLPSELQVILMSPNTSIQQAESLIRSFVVEQELKRSLLHLTPEQRVQLLADAKATKGKILKKEKD